MINTRIVKKAITFGIRHFTQEIDYYLGKGLSKPDLVEINLTRRCNAKCQMCDFWKTTDREENEVHAEKWIKTIEELYKWIGPFTLVLSGGEIFIKKGIYRIIKRVIDLNISLTMVTNGMVFRSDENLKRLFNTGVRSIVFSLDGLVPEIHDKLRGREGLHDNVVSAIVKIKKKKPEINITTTCIVMKDTISQMVDYVYWAKNLGIDGVQFQPISPNYDQNDVRQDWYNSNAFFIHDVGRVNEVIDKLIKMRRKDNFIGNTEEHLEKIKEYFKYPDSVQAKQSRCMLGQTTLIINEYGNMSFCSKMAYSFGNIDNGPIRETWRSPEAMKIRKKVKNCQLPCMALCYRSFSFLDKVSLFLKYAKMGRL